MINDYILESLKQSEEQLKIKEQLFGAPKYVVSGEYIPFELIHREKPRLKDLCFRHCQEDRMDATICAFKHYNEITKQQEETKMEAKKCDRCGDLYTTEKDEPIKAYLCGRVTDGEKATYRPEKLKEFNTYEIDVILSVRSRKMDMCPNCKKKLVDFFEAGAVKSKKE